MKICRFKGPYGPRVAILEGSEPVAEVAVCSLRGISDFGGKSSLIEDIKAGINFLLDNYLSKDDEERLLRKIFRNLRRLANRLARLRSNHLCVVPDVREPQIWPLVLAFKTH
jgi:hypothetical protein